MKELVLIPCERQPDRYDPTTYKALLSARSVEKVILFKDGSALIQSYGSDRYLIDAETLRTLRTYIIRPLEEKDR